jgi:hypothetical protein
VTKEEFLSLPTSVALGVLFDAAHPTLCTVPAPSASTSAPVATGDVRPPRFDTRVGRKGGFVFASEMLLHDLQWWLEKKRESAASGGPHAQKDKKLADELERWVAWRRVAPSETWRGIRGESPVTAEPPRRDATLHSWGDRAPAKLAPPPPSDGYGDPDFATGSDDDIPF